MCPQSLYKAVETNPSVAANTPLVAKDASRSISLPSPTLHVNHQWTKILRRNGTITHDTEVLAFAPRYRFGLDGEPVDKMLDELFPTISNNTRKATRYALQAALLSLCQCFQSTWKYPQSDFLAVWYCTDSSLKFPNYKKHRQPFTRHVFSKVMKALEAHGYAERFRGFRGSEAIVGVPSLWRHTEKLMINFYGANVYRLQLVRLPVETQLLRVSDLETKQPIDFEDTPYTHELTEAVSRANALRVSQAWEFDYDIGNGLQKREISRYDLECYRRFHYDFGQHGRFYCPAQGMSKQQRQTLTINGKPTIEADYKAHHPRMMYHLKGLKAPIDSYDLEDLRISRDSAKAAMLRAINCESKRDAVKSVREELGCRHVEAQRLIERIEEIHQPIHAMLFRGIGHRLMTLDARMAEWVINRATDKGIPVLPIHDSFVAPETAKDFLIEAMIEAYEVVIGPDYEPVIEIVGEEEDADELDDGDF